jgi:hypothetical protein
MRRYRSEAKVKVSYMRQRRGGGTAALASGRSRDVNITEGTRRPPREQLII